MLIACLKFKYKCVSCISSGNPTPSPLSLRSLTPSPPEEQVWCSPVAIQPASGTSFYPQIKRSRNRRVCFRRHYRIPLAFSAKSQEPQVLFKVTHRCLFSGRMEGRGEDHSPILAGVPSKPHPPLRSHFSCPQGDGDSLPWTTDFSVSGSWRELWE